MNNPCSVELLESALVGELPPQREELLHRHLAECEACSAALEQLAGGEAWRQELAATLTGDELDDALLARDEWSNADFTVEHLEPADEPGVLGRLGGYDVLEIIGRGGMGVVLKGFDRELKRCVAIKVLSPHLAASSLARKRFAREAQAAAAVVHPNVLAIHQVQPAGRLPFLVMPLVAGESLAQRLTAQGRLELKEVLRIGMQAAAGLSAAHEQGLVHRDVKPANILLEKGVERAVLTDFGLARAADDVSMTRWGIIAGTPQYMSPEQAKGEPLDGRSDLFSLGCVLYEMATGVSPFRADSTLATLRRLIDDPPPVMASHDPELPPWFIGIVERLLEKDPSKRFASAKEVSELLEGCLAHLQQPASVPLPATCSPLPPGEGQGVRAAASSLKVRKRFILGALVMLGLIGISLFTVGVVSTTPPDIAGNWQGEGWGQVVLTQTAPGEYIGTYTDTVAQEKEPGKIDLKWSRIERRFNGTWHEGEDDRFGELSIRLADQEIRGALTTDAKSKINPATPRLADVTWTRNKTASAAGQEGRAPTAVPQATRPLEVHLEKNRVVIKAWAPAGTRISFYAGERNNGWGCVFPRATGFTASLENAETGLNCRVVPETGDPVLTLIGAKHIGSVVLSNGQFIVRFRGIHKERDGSETATIGQWTAKSGEVIEIGVTLTPPQSEGKTNRVPVSSPRPKAAENSADGPTSGPRTTPAEPATAATPIPAELQKPTVGENYVIVPLSAMTELQRNLSWSFPETRLYVVINGRAIVNDKDTQLDSSAVDYNGLLRNMYKYKLAGVRGRTQVDIVGAPDRAEDWDAYSAADGSEHKSEDRPWRASDALMSLLNSQAKAIGPAEVGVLVDRDAKCSRPWETLVAELTTAPTEEQIRGEAGVSDGLMAVHRVTTPLSRFLMIVPVDCVIRNVRPLGDLTPQEMHGLLERARPLVAKLGFTKPPRAAFVVACGNSWSKSLRADRQLGLFGSNHWQVLSKTMGVNLQRIGSWDMGRPGVRTTLRVHVLGLDGRPVSNATVAMAFPPETRELFKYDVSTFDRQKDGSWLSDPLPDDEEFTLTVAAPGYEPQSQKLKVPLGQTKELDVKLNLKKKWQKGI